jgi:bifunctional ADP-heptose synthase (sugar kinase/adenylyltransferase)
LNKNVKLYNLSPTHNIQKKTRYINNYRGQKIFQLTNFDKSSFSLPTQSIIAKKIKKALINNTVICDFGIGLFEGKIIDLINNSQNDKYLNVQSNSINFGFNLFTKYKKQKSLRYISLDEREWQLGIKENTHDYKTLKKFLNSNTSFSITLGKEGSFYYEKQKKFSSPIFSDKAVDTTGCGDAYFIMTSLLKIVNTNPVLIPFLGNIYAGMHALNLANKNLPTKVEYLKYIKSLFNF